MSEAFGRSGNCLKLAVVLAAALGSSVGLALAQSNDPPCPDRSPAPDGRSVLPCGVCSWADTELS
jgi:hypothetical protein